MSVLFEDGPIVACSSGTSERSAISVLRISGFSSISLFKDHFVGLPKSGIKSRFAHYIKLVDDKKNVLDSCLILYFPGPHSFTGENLIQLHLHGNPINVRRISDFLKKKFFIRSALPGEFSFRALKNKKLSLGQVEGLDLFLNSSSHFALDQAQEVMSGEVLNEYKELHNAFLNLKVRMEIFFDFLEDVGPAEAERGFNQAFHHFKNVISSFKNRIERRNFDLNNPTITLSGPVNAGKSSLFNNLLNENRAIVSSEAGTTRDYLAENLFYRGVLFRLIDTAGQRDESGAIEGEGIRRGNEQLNKSFFKILVLSGANQDSRSMAKNQDKKFDLIVWTHRDIGISEIELEKLSSDTPCLFVSNTNSNLTEDFDAILSLAFEKFQKETERRPLLIDRHRDLLEQITLDLTGFELLLEREKDVAILDSELYLIGQKIEQLIGVITPSDVLDHLFGNFCIGK